MLRAAYGLDAPPAGETSRLDLRAYGAVLRAARRARGWRRSTASSPRRGGRARSSAPRSGSRPAGEAGRVAVLDLLRARTRRFEVVFVLGLEEGSLPRRPRTSPFLDDDRAPRARRRGSSAPTRSAATATSSTPPARAPTRRLYLVREAATDEGAPREPSPFWEEVAAVFDRRRRRARDDAAAALGAHAGRSRRAPTERERLRALARPRRADVATRPSRSPTRTAGSGGSRARAPRVRPRDAAAQPRRVLAELGAKTTFGATELERFADCSSAWLFERVISTRRRSTPRPTRCCAARSRTARCTSSTPGSRRSSAPTASRRRTSSRRSGSSARCLDDALRGGVRLELDRRCRRPSSRRASGATSRGSSATRRRSPLPARAAPVRGRRSAPTARRRELQRGLAPRRRPVPERQDRPHRRRPVQRARDRAGLQVGQERALGEADRRGAEAPDPAVHARAARPRRHRAARRRLPRARRRARQRAACCGRGAPTTCPGFQRQRLPRRRATSGRSSRRRASARAATPSGSARATCATTRRAATCPAWCDLWTMCRVERSR